MNLLALFLGWLIAKTISIGPASSPVSPAPTPPPPGGTRRPTTRTTARPTATPRGSTVPVSTTRAVAAPWPQVVPSGLPPFPGSGWVPDSPPPADVQARAMALLPQLWANGVGTFKTEKLGARWITFRAVDMGGKKGVVAYRLKHVAVLDPQGVPLTDEVPNVPGLPKQFGGVPGTVHASTSPMAPPLLVKGSQGEEVKMVQRKLNVTPTGFYGDVTVAAVKAFQAQRGLTVDGKTGRETWGALFGGGRA